MKKTVFVLSIALSCSLFADVYATFEAKATKEALLNMSVSGIVENINVSVGSKVSKGQTLLTLNDREEQALLKTARADYKFLSRQFERHEKSADVFDKNTLEKLNSELQKAKNTLSYHEERASKMKLEAPFAGVIAEKNIEVGDMSAISPKGLFRLISNDVKLVLQFDSKHASSVKVGQNFCYNLNGKVEAGCVKITKIYPTLDAQTKKLTAETEGGGFKVGSFGDGQIKTAK